MEGGLFITDNRLIVSVLSFSFVSFLLTFPNFGPTSFALINTHNIDARLYFTPFYVSHITGLLVSGTFVDKVSKRIRIAKISALIILFSAILSNFYPLIAIALIGFFLGVLADVMGSLLGRIVKPWMRGSVIALGTSLANVFMFIFSSFKMSTFDMTVLSTIPLIPIFLLPEVKLDKVEVKGLNSEMWKFVPPVVIFYLLAGFMYHTMEPVFRSAIVSMHVLAYVVTIVIAGVLYDRIGRKITTILGLFLLGLSFALFPKYPIISAYVIQSSYAFLDIFSILIWVDLAYFGTEGKHYGIGTSILVTSILLGYWIMNIFELNPFDFGFVSLILLIASAIFIASTKEPMLSPEEYILRAGGAGRCS